MPSSPKCPPHLAQSANIIKTAHSLYWSKANRKRKRDGNFVRKSCDVLVSKLVDRLSDQNPNLSFMI